MFKYLHGSQFVMNSAWIKHPFISQIDKHIVAWMKQWGMLLLRYSLAVVFIWFGFYKILGVSAANELVAKTVYWFDPHWFIPFLGIWEMLIGICLIRKSLIRLGLLLMAGQMIGTFLPLIIHPEITFISFPFVLSLEGQYIVKNIVLISAGIVVGSHVRDQK